MDKLLRICISAFIVVTMSPLAVQKAYAYDIDDVAINTSNTYSKVRDIYDWMTNQNTGLLYYLKSMNTSLINISNRTAYISDIYSWMTNQNTGLLSYLKKQNDSLISLSNNVSYIYSEIQSVNTWLKDGSSGLVSYLSNIQIRLKDIDDAISNISSGGGSGVWTREDIARLDTWFVDLNGKLGLLYADTSTIISMLSDMLTDNDDIIQHLADIAENNPSGMNTAIDTIKTTVDNIDTLVGDNRAYLRDIYQWLTNQNNGLKYYLDSLEDTAITTSNSVWYIRDIYDWIYSSNGFPKYVNDIITAIQGIQPGGGDYSGITLRLDTIQGTLSDIHDLIGAWFTADTAQDIVGTVDFTEVKNKSDALLENLSKVAPFGAVLLISECVGIYSQTPISDPVLQFDFKFMPGSDYAVHIDLHWLDNAIPLIHFVCLTMLVLSLVGATMRFVEQEVGA